MPGPDGSPAIFPSDHARAIVELLRPASPDLARRWLAALLIVPAGERIGVVEAVERSIVREYGGAGGTVGVGARLEESHGPLAGIDRSDDETEARRVRVAGQPVQREGYVEQVFTEYEVRPDGTEKATGGEANRASSGGKAQAQAEPKPARRKRG